MAAQHATAGSGHILSLQVVSPPFLKKASPATERSLSVSFTVHSSRSLPRRDGWRGTAAPRSVARQALPRQRSAISVVATSARCCAMQAFGRARAIGAAKSFSFKK